MPKGTRFLRLLLCVSVKSATRRAASSHDIKVKKKMTLEGFLHGGFTQNLLQKNPCSDSGGKKKSPN